MIRKTLVLSCALALSTPFAWANTTSSSQSAPNTITKETASAPKVAHSKHQAVSNLSVPSAQTMDLLAAYLAAKKQDMQYQSAEATYFANRYEVPIAYANLLPTLTISGGYSWQRTKIKGLPKESTHGENYSLTLDQAIFNFGAWKAVGLADATVKSETAKFTLAAQQLIHRVTNAYFTVLLDQDQLRFAKQNELALKQQYKQIKAQYDVGTKAESDLQSAKASLESATASRVEAANQLANAHFQLAVITNEHHAILNKLKPNVQFPKPTESEHDWVKYGLMHNLNLIVAKSAVEVAKAKIYATYGGAEASQGVPGYLPTVSAQAKATGDNSKGKNITTQSTNTQSVGINVNWNLYQGGITQNTIKQDQYKYQAALDNAQQAEREAVSSIKQDYRNVLSDLSQISAYKQAVTASQVALKATRAAYNAGTRTIVDLLTEQSNLYQAQQNYAKAVNQYILDSLQLKADAGALTIKDVKSLNLWLK